MTATTMNHASSVHSLIEQMQTLGRRFLKFLKLSEQANYEAGLGARGL